MFLSFSIPPHDDDYPRADFLIKEEGKEEMPDNYNCSNVVYCLELANLPEIPGKYTEFSIWQISGTLTRGLAGTKAGCRRPGCRHGGSSEATPAGF